jgi:hypothetical protein
MRDDAFGRAKIKMRVQSEYKFQNVTLAGDGEEAGDNNRNAVDSNPLSGKIYTFGHLAPRWNEDWLRHQTTANQQALTAFSGRPINPGTYGYDLLSVNDLTAVGIPELSQPPTRANTIFKNVKTSDKIHFPPGGFKVYKTQFSKEVTVRTLLRGLTQVMRRPVAEVPPGGTVAGKYPSFGESFIMCLLPSIKTGQENIKMAYDVHRDGFASITKFRGGTLPTTMYTA